MTVTLTDELPTGAAFVDASIDGGSCAYSSQVTCSLHTLTATQTATATVVITLPAGSGVITSTAIVSATTPDLNLANNTAVTVLGVRTPIHVIQGAGHTSPLVGQVVTPAASSRPFATMAFTCRSRMEMAMTQHPRRSLSTPRPARNCRGRRIDRGRPGCRVSARQPCRQQSDHHRTHRPQLPGAVRRQCVACAGRTRERRARSPSTVIEDDDLAEFDPSADGLDFDESLEAMRVQIDDAVVVGPSNRFGEIWVLADNGAGAGPRTARGGIHVTASDFNPERFQLDDTLYPLNDWPDVSVGARFTVPVVGVVDYSFGNYELLATEAVTVDVSQVVTRATTALLGDADRVTIATFNVENLGGDASDAAFTARANLIVNHLASPDILVLEEIQDNNGATDDGTTAADVTYTRLISAVQVAGGPVYAFPADRPSGQAGRRRARGQHSGRFPVQPGAALIGSRQPRRCNDGQRRGLCLRCGSIDPESWPRRPDQRGLYRQPEAACRPVYLCRQIAVRRGRPLQFQGRDTPLYGAVQPPVLNSETQRLAQAQAVHDFVATILACEPGARVIVLGDVNDYPFSAPVATLKVRCSPILWTCYRRMPNTAMCSRGTARCWTRRW